MDHASAASTSLDRSAVNLVPTTAATLPPVGRTRAGTVPRAARSTATAVTAASRAYVGPGSRDASVSTRHRRRRRRQHGRAGRDSASTAAGA